MAAQRFDQIIGYPHVKRALEVAITGMHSVGILRIGGAQAAEQFMAIAHENGIRCILVQPCRCGNLGSVENDCTCSHDEIAAHQATNAMRYALSCDVFIKVYANDASRYSEHDHAIYRRIDAARAAPVPSRELSRTGQSLMDAAIRMLNLQTGDAYQVVGVAATIARLAGSRTISPAHLAEALQYTAGRKEG